MGGLPRVRRLERAHRGGPGRGVRTGREQRRLRHHLDQPADRAREHRHAGGLRLERDPPERLGPPRGDEAHRGAVEQPLDRRVHEPHVPRRADRPPLVVLEARRRDHQLAVAERLRERAQQVAPLVRRPGPRGEEDVPRRLGPARARAQRPPAARRAAGARTSARPPRRRPGSARAARPRRRATARARSARRAAAPPRRRAARGRAGSGRSRTPARSVDPASKAYLHSAS